MHRLMRGSIDMRRVFGMIAPGLESADPGGIIMCLCRKIVCFVIMIWGVSGGVGRALEIVEGQTNVDKATLTPKNADILSLAFSGVDDVADAWIINKDTVKSDAWQPALRAEWNGKKDGAASANIAQHLVVGENYLVLTLLNKVYKGKSSKSSGGKYQANMLLQRNGKTVYEKSLYKDHNESEVVFVGFLKVTLSRRGKITVSESFTKVEEKALQALVGQILQPYLIKTTGGGEVCLAQEIARLMGDQQISPALTAFLGGFLMTAVRESDE